MTIEYTLSGADLVRGFWNSLRCSWRYRAGILLYAAAMGLLFWRARSGWAQPPTVKDVMAASLGIVFFLAFMSLWLFVRAKTARRTLSISPEGISTPIGKLQGQIPWSSVKLIEDNKDFVLISRINGNAFYIPGNAFTGSEHRSSFINEARALKAGK